MKSANLKEQNAKKTCSNRFEMQPLKVSEFSNPTSTPIMEVEVQPDIDCHMDDISEVACSVEVSLMRYMIQFSFSCSKSIISMNIRIFIRIP